MLGAIIGDIAGSRFEFANTSDYNFDMFSPLCDYTDDSICTVAVADALMHSLPMADTMRRWCRRYPDPMGAYGSGFHAWILSDTMGPYNSFGNGAAMRVAAAGWLAADRDEAVRMATESAAITHNHPEGIKGAVATALAIYDFRTGQADLDALFEQYYGAPIDGYKYPRRGYFDVTCQGCVPLALRIVRDSRDFDDAVRSAVVYGGDSDTLAAIVGAIAEARFGIPAEMKNRALAYLPADMRGIVDEFYSRLK